MSNVEMKPIYFDREQRPVRKKERIENVFDCFSGIRVWLEKRVKKIVDLHWKINFQKAAKERECDKIPSSLSLIKYDLTQNPTIEVGR